jgi:hypothetical protein
LSDLLVLASCHGQREKGEHGRQGDSYHGAISGVMSGTVYTSHIVAIPVESDFT